MLAAATAMALLAPLSVPSASAAPVVDDLPTLNITVDPALMKAVNDDPDHDTKAPVTMSLEGAPTAELNFTDLPGEIKGRGNFTWTLDKRPYQIKFAANTGVLGMAPQSTWVLLANHADASLMRNKVAFDFATSIGILYTPESRWVDVRVNDDYLGNYLLSEKTEVKTNRVQLTDPQGVLVELDNRYGDVEDWKFWTDTSKSLFVLKEAVSKVADLPDPLSPNTAAGWADIQESLNRLDALLAAPTVDWPAVEAVIDVDSFVRFYFVSELTANSEITGSSVYFYKDGPNSKVFAGPVWDFDSSLGNFDKAPWYGSEAGSDYAKSVKTLKDANNPATAPEHNGWFEELFRQRGFVERANQMWAEGIGAAAAEIPAKIDAWGASLAKSAGANFTEWPILGKPSLLVASIGKTYATTYAGEVTYLRDWVNTRVTMLSREHAPTPVLSYESHIQRIGWQGRYNFGQVSGTVGQSKRMEALRLSSPGTSTINSIEADAHVQDIGWMGYRNAAEIGTTGRSLRLEAVKFRLTGDLATKYDISYRTHVQDIGWQPWVTNGKVAGTEGQAKRVEAIQIRLLAKTGASDPVPVGVTTYNVHSQDIGWGPNVKDGAVAGVLGKRLEALKLKASSEQVSGDISYRAHVQDIGWMSWQTSANFIGTTGRSLRMEAFEVKLTGVLAAEFDVEYRAYVQGSGWQSWRRNGQTAGTTGQSLRLEQVAVRLVPKA